MDLATAGPSVLARARARLTPSRSRAWRCRAWSQRNPARRARRAPPITVAPGAPRPAAIPHSWLGLSTEYWTLPLFAQHEAAFERVLGLLRVRGGGPLVFGSAGTRPTTASGAPMADACRHGRFSLTRRWTASVSGLVRRLGLRLILDLNLITATPRPRCLGASGPGAAAGAQRDRL